MFLMNDFIESIVLSGFAATLFLGGWQVPGLVSDGSILVAVIQVLAFSIKVAAVLFLLMQVRWTLPRFRFDQVLDLGWKLLLPLSIANLLATVWLVYWVEGSIK
jgi:NADH-quinone oxidoreductase subunit H